MVFRDNDPGPTGPSSGAGYTQDAHEGVCGDRPKTSKLLTLPVIEIVAGPFCQQYVPDAS